ncbi:SDR family NAD(P)-dependent oxidoreductase [Bradyrhizobium sp. 195]|nr:SDR family NAD(P)-dependent oxidoreductase [Bradyrhizobium sp. 195]
MAARKTWFITGCDSGMGLAIAETVLEHGNVAVMTALNPANVAGLRERFPNTAICHQLDITDGGSIKRVVDAAETMTKGIDVLVNNAGYGILGAAEETTPAEYRPMFEVNFFGLAEVTRAVLPGMRKRRRGHIFNTSSSGGYAASPGFAFYAASKFAVEGFSDALAQEVAAFGINVTIVEPGSTRTNFAGSSLKRPLNPIPDYEQSAVSLTATRMTARDGAQPGDPKRLAKALIQLTDEKNPPLRIPLGEDAIDRLEKRVATQAAEFQKWRSLSLSIAFDSPANPV